MHDFPSRLASVIGEESVNSFARRVGCSEGVIRAYLRGSQSPGMKLLVRIAEISGASVEWLATGKERRERTAPPPKPVPHKEGSEDSLVKFCLMAPPSSIQDNPRWQELAALIDRAPLTAADTQTLLSDLHARAHQAVELAALRQKLEALQSKISL